MQQEQNELVNNHHEAPQPPLPEETLSQFAQLLGLLGISCSKTGSCKHKRGCVEGVLRDSGRIAFFSYLIKCGLSTVFGIKRIFKSPTQLLKILVSRDSVNFGLFVGSFVLIFRGLLCALRRVVR